MGLVLNQDILMRLKKKYKLEIEYIAMGITRYIQAVNTRKSDPNLLQTFIHYMNLIQMNFLRIFFIKLRLRPTFFSINSKILISSLEILFVKIKDKKNIK